MAGIERTLVGADRRVRPADLNGRPIRSPDQTPQEACRTDLARFSHQVARRSA